MCVLSSLIGRCLGRLFLGLFGRSLRGKLLLDLALLGRRVHGPGRAEDAASARHGLALRLEWTRARLQVELGPLRADGRLLLWRPLSVRARLRGRSLRGNMLGACAISEATAARAA